MTDIFSEPIATELFYCYEGINTSGFTKLMKWVMLTKSNPDLLANIKHLIESDPVILDKQNEIGWTALMLACVNSSTHSCVKTLELLLSFKPNLELKTSPGKTALALLCSLSRETEETEVIELLIRAGANVNAIDDSGYSVLMFAYNEKGRNISTMKLLIEAGADVNKQSM